MASNVTSTAVRILEKPDDWEPWIWQMQAEIAPALWPSIDPDLSNRQIKRLLAEPEKPRFQDVNQHARTYAALTPEEKKEYHDLRSYYTEDLKQYQRQEDQLEKARTKIVAKVSKSKAMLLDPKKTVRE